MERTDLLAVHTDTRRTLEVQVNTASFNKAPSWLIGAKAQQPSPKDHEWFVLVLLPQETHGAPRSFVMPRDHVAAAAWIRHQDWLTEEGVPAGKRNTPLDRARIQEWVAEGYEDRWDLLHQPASQVPVLLPSGFRSLALTERVGLPPGHPWCAELPAW